MNELTDNEFKKEVINRLNELNKRIIIATSLIKIVSNPNDIKIAINEFENVLDVIK